MRDQFKQRELYIDSLGFHKGQTSVKGQVLGLEKKRVLKELALEARDACGW